ncbi:MAG: hypothetical protein ACRDTA_00785 [Pseudonocardiaceae bacterium]
MNTTHRGPDGTVRLIGAILRGTPSLPGAACIGRHELFDDVAQEDPATRRERLDAAAELSRSPDLPAISSCLYSLRGATAPNGGRRAGLQGERGITG